MVKPKKKHWGRQKINNGRAQNQVVSLPLDIIINILSRLPAVTILKCRSVCKSWNSMTREQSFIKLQLQRSKDNDDQTCNYIILHEPSFSSLLLLNIHQDKINGEISFKKMKRLSSLHVISSYNGLLCLSPEDSLDSVVIWNPIVSDFFILPSTTRIFPSRPCKSYHIGFHFDSSSCKSKIVREFRFSDDEASKFEVITAGESSWKELNGAPDFAIEQGFDSTIFWNGGFHWKISERDHRHDESCVLRFDLSNEKFYVICFVDHDQGDEGYYCKYNVPHNYQLVNLGGDLKLVDHDSRFLKIWGVVGNKVEGFSILLQHRYVLCVPRSRLLHYSLICQIDEGSYLMQVFRWEQGVEKCSIVKFKPEIGQYLELEIDGLPDLFRILCFRPSFAPILV